MEILLETKMETGLSPEEIRQAVQTALAGHEYQNVLLIPPDYTRYHSNAGYIAGCFYQLLSSHANVDVLPALGTHVPMTEAEFSDMYPAIPFERMLVHRWKTDVVHIGDVPGSLIEQVTEGLETEPLVCEVNRLILDPKYDLIVSIGQVVPHEVIGMANYTKNILVGCGGSRTIHRSHMIGALFGMERMMGKDHTPVREALDYGADHFLKDRPILYALTVTTAPKGNTITHGFYIGKDRSVFEAAVRLAQAKNIDFLDRGIDTCVVYLDSKEFKTTWLGNKAIYRTRMAIKAGGKLIILAPGVHQFGEDDAIDLLIRKYGYRGRDTILNQFQIQPELKQSMATAAHLIHGSSDGRFDVIYAPGHLTREEVEGVGYQYANLSEMLGKYPPETLKTGWNTLSSGEEIFFIPNPALGLWIDRHRF